jgi:hypothetical protein
MRLPDFTAEASLYGASETRHSMEAAGLAGGDVLRAQASQFIPPVRCISCGGGFCCKRCGIGSHLYCTGLTGGGCRCSLPF